MNLKSRLRALVPSFGLNFYHFLWAFFGAVIYRFPGKNKSIKIIGVTGTSGKSTTTNFISAILEEAGYKVASISTIRFKLGEKEWENKFKMTLPGRFHVQKFLRQAVNAKCDFVVLEVTSEGIRQSRHRFINFDTAVFTNLSKEHIESHGSFENYRNEKLKLFKANRNVHVINKEDPNTSYFWDIPAKQKIGFTAEDVSFPLPVEGIFNRANAAAAVAVAKVYGVNMDVCQTALQKVSGVPGRMEIISQSPKVVVDYAHTPEQLEQVYKSFPNKNLVCVLGSCGGGRDKWKRPVLGEVAKQYCTQIFVTNEDPYDEDPMAIIDAVAETAGENVQRILDRKEAIQKAISIAQPQDVVVITGKGSEPWLCVANGKKIPWDDRQLAREALKGQTLTNS